MDVSSPVILAVFAKSTVAEITLAAKKISARKKRDGTGDGKYLAEHIARAEDCEIDDWYADQDDGYEENEARRTN